MFCISFDEELWTRVKFGHLFLVALSRLVYILCCVLVVFFCLTSFL